MAKRATKDKAVLKVMRNAVTYVEAVIAHRVEHWGVVKKVKKEHGLEVTESEARLIIKKELLRREKNRP